MDEPWDELMGPSPDDLKKMLRSDPPPDPPVRRSAGPPSAPPSSMFNSLPDRWAQSEQEAPTASAVPPPSHARSRSNLAFEDEEEDDEEDYKPAARDHAGIRQEALKMLEVADDALHNSSYSVHRTVTGGFTATANPMGNKKRVPSALSALQYTSNRREVGRSSFRDSDDFDSYNTKQGPQYDYSERDMVNLERTMESRTAASRPAEDNNSKSAWSSRYSVDSTLLALSGGSLSTSSYLDKMDERERLSARNMYTSSPHTEIFGSGGFNFRKKKVFGSQKVTIQPNLQTVHMDDAGASSSRSKSWQDQLRQKNRKRRAYIAAIIVVCAFVITMGTLYRNRNDNSESLASMTPGDITFYVTSNAPYDTEGEQKLLRDMQSFSEQGKVFVHLGNTQDASETQCETSRYGRVAKILKTSPIPTFVVPGEEDWNNCPNPDDAWDAWFSSFHFFHSNFYHNFHVQSQDLHYENFSFLHSGVLFLSVHVVGGNVVDAEETAQRNADCAQWVTGMTNTHKDDIRALVIFGNARPGLVQNFDFFDPVAEYVKDLGMPVAYVHANAGLDGLVQYQPFEDAENVFAFQADDGEDSSPLRMTVGFGEEPFIIG